MVYLHRLTHTIYGVMSYDKRIGSATQEFLSEYVKFDSFDAFFDWIDVRLLGFSFNPAFC